MTQPDTLHTRLRDEINRRLVVARAAADQYGPCWLITRIPPYTDPVLLAGDGGDDLVSAGTVDLHEAHQVHIALHDPADAVRRYERDLKTLERHAPVEVHTNIDPRMVACAYEWGDGDGYVVPYEFCPHIKDLADDYLEAVNG